MTGIWLVLTLILVFILGALAGTLGSRFTLKKYFEKNPPITEEMIESMLSSMGQAPNKKRVKQIMKSMKNR
ncbi:MAG: YneF family protein [Mycoplasmatales bacterium]